ncbi:MAG: glycosyltransferase family 2 protein [Nitrospirota bacterium]
MLPLVYIIVLNYNRRDDTLECLRSLFHMDYPNFKVLVVDNASSDGTADAARKAYPQAEVLENEKNLMYAGGNNEGIRFALAHGADWILLLNNDTVVDGHLVSEMINAAYAHPEAGVLGPMIYYYTRKGQPSGRRSTGSTGREVIWYAGGIVKLWMGLTAHRGLREEDTGRYGRIEETDYITGCAMLVSRGCLDKVGLLDTSYGMYAEDADFSLRARRAGFRLLFVPGGKVWHKISMSTGGEFSLFKTRLKIRSNLRFFTRFSRPWHWLTMPFSVAVRGAIFFMRRIFMK